MNFIYITALYVIVGGVAVGIFLWGKPDGNSLFDRLYRVVCVYLPHGLKWSLEKCFGKRASRALDAIWTYLCYTNNPLVQIFYLCVVVGGFICFVLSGFPHIPNSLLPAYHKFTGSGVFVACVTVWWRACSSDPGTVTPDNVGALCKIFDWDGQLFASQECRTCRILKPARSKHCGLCNICVARFDHHCIWINNCVGIGNHKWFLGFLFFHMVLCAYAVYSGLSIIYLIVIEKDLFSAVYVDPVTKERHPATYKIVLQYMLATQGMVIFISILAGVMGLVLCGFFLWHCNLVRMGTTTNELSKWNYLKWILKKEGPEGKEKLKGLRNIYNLGLVANFREVLFNVDVHKLAPVVSENGKKVKQG